MKQAFEVPLVEQLERVPANARLVIDSDDGFATSFIAVGRMCHEAASALRQAIAEAEKQEPVPIGELSEFLDCEKCSHCQTVNEDRDNYCLLQRKVVYETCEKFSHWEGKPRPIYPPAAQPAQPKRQWVGLTEQERNDIEDLCEMMIGKPAFDAIEKKLKGKNT